MKCDIFSLYHGKFWNRHHHIMARSHVYLYFDRLARLFPGDLSLVSYSDTGDNGNCYLGRELSGSAIFVALNVTPRGD